MKTYNMKLCCLILTIFITKIHCVSFKGTNYILSEPSIVNGVSIRTVHTEDDPTKYIIRSVYNNSYLKTGWDILDISSGSVQVKPEAIAFFAGFAEGVQTSKAIYDYYYNTIRPKCVDIKFICTKIDDYFKKNQLWLESMIKQHQDTDVYWKQVALFYYQVQGIFKGYNQMAAPGEKLKFIDFLWLTHEPDTDDLFSVFEEKKAPKGSGHCSALIKLLPGEADIFVAHNTWTDYVTMRRIIKRYSLNFPKVKSTSVAFSGYPGTLVSIDDYYITNSGLVVQETTNSNNNETLWSLVKPVGQVLETLRVTVANQLADGGQSWTKIFSRYNSGTYNNQWMVVDMKRFSSGSVKSDLLWVAEQMPGYIRREDKTDVLKSQGYWASYNIPYYKDVYKMMGYGNDYTHDTCPRALIFKRDQGKVTDLNSMMSLMRSNDYEHDPLSQGSPENAIACRGDLVGSCFGAIDAKVTSYKMSKTLSMMAVSGPTTGTNLPPFRWSKSSCISVNPLSHRGQPDLFNFKPIIVSWDD